MKFLVQSGDIMKRERACILMGLKSYKTCGFDILPTMIDECADYIPVGSVEFTKEFARLANISLPENLSYPKELLPFLKRSVWQDKFSNVDDNLFVKPVKTKVFTGGIKKNLTESVNPDEEVWVSDPLDIEAEFRYYVLDGIVVGQSRYDDDDNEIEADESVVLQIIKKFTNQPVGYAIDVGVAKGETFLIEINDGWSLGYYPWGNCSQRNYVELITKRWIQIKESK